MAYTSFNSQRDGILRGYASLYEGRGDRVSIPNGMEFYLKLAELQVTAGVVSIPNGMEFYAQRAKMELPPDKFQFPTGWNSTCRYPC